jgi:hypothetical protein
MQRYEELNDFINGLSFRSDDQPGDSIKIAEELVDLPEEALLEMAGYDTSTPEEKQAMLSCKSDDAFLSQFEGSPLYGQAIAVAQQELEMEKQHLMARAARDQDDHWKQESQDRDMLNIQKRQLELELHKSKAQSAAMAAQPMAAPAEAPAQEALPAEAPPEAAAEKMAALADAQQEKGLGKAMVGLAKAKMDPDRKAALAKGLRKAVSKEKAEGDPMKLSAFVVDTKGVARVVKDLPKKLDLSEIMKHKPKKLDKAQLEGLRHVVKTKKIAACVAHRSKKTKKAAARPSSTTQAEKGLPITPEFQALSTGEKARPVLGAFGGMGAGIGAGVPLVAGGVDALSRGKKLQGALLTGGGLLAAVGGPHAGKYLATRTLSPEARAAHTGQLAAERKALEGMTAAEKRRAYQLQREQILAQAETAKKKTAVRLPSAIQAENAVRKAGKQLKGFKSLLKKAPAAAK